MFQAYPHQQQRQSPVKPTDTCFKCGKPGHWANSCPENPNNRSPISQPINFDQQFPATHCRCGGGHCEIITSHSINNPNKKFYSCPGKNGMNCTYFNWCDKENVRVIQPKPYPVCTCGAGVCTLVKGNGVNAGRSYFVCRVDKGYGACNFIQWLDNSPESVSITSSNPVACQSATLDDLEISEEDAMKLDAIEMSARTPESRSITSSNPVARQSARLDDLDISDEEALQLDAIEKSARTPSKDVHVESDDGEAYGLRMETPGVHPHPFMNNIMENSDSEMIIQNGDTWNNQMHSTRVDNTQASHTEGAQPRFGIIPYQSSPLKNNLQEGSNMTSMTVEAVGNFALQLQNDLIKKLECTNPHSHEIMTNEANSTFSALGCLQVDYKPLYSKVMEYIKQASSLAHIEQLINIETSLEDLETHRDNVLQRFKDLEKSQQEAQDALNAANNQFSLLCAKASVLGSPSELIKKKLSTCKAEIAHRQETLLEITESIAECNECLQEVEEALEESEMRGVEWSEAQAAFQKARAQLRI